jgi:ABC-2 type transport system ATP-binding protein
MLAVEAHHIVKSFASKVVVDDLSFSVQQGEVFGLIGPNGAGKTTTIRMMMDIIKPDIGEVVVLGEKLSEATKNKLGYLPEERGLYKKLSVLESIVYLASLKGMDRHTAEEEAHALLDRTGMVASKRKKVEELSRGMGQMIQFIITIIHDPLLVVLDEPFSGLDPVNTELLKGMLVDLRTQGKAVILSTHQMNQVEELCDRILMVNNGQAVLYGDLSEIKSRYRGNSILVNVEGELGNIPGVTDTRMNHDHTVLTLESGTTPQRVLAYMVQRGMVIHRFEVATPSLHEIFLKEVGKTA